MNLYIIGNGFDLAHGLPTSYFDFRKYLDASDWQFLVDLESLYDCTPNSIIELVYDRLWKEFEANLASVNDSEMIDAGIQIKMGLESGDVEIEDTLDVHWEQQYGYIEKLNDYIKSWAKSIDVRVPKKTNKIKSKTNDLFISFNYTLLLEKTYRIESDQILHIHGSVDRGDQLQPVLGHGNKQKIHDARKKARIAKEAYMEKETSIYNALANYYERTCKDVDYYLFFMIAFLENSHQYSRFLLSDIHWATWIYHISKKSLKKLKRMLYGMFIFTKILN